MRLLLLLLTVLSSIIADGFVELVECTAENLTVVLNKTDPDVAAWLADPDAQPVLYIYDHKLRRECGTSLKNENNEIRTNLTIPYGQACDVALVDIEPNHKTAESTVVLENTNENGLGKGPRINHIFCLYTRTVQTIRINTVENTPGIAASTGGKPMPKVDMLFRSSDGRPLRAAKFGDSIEFYVALSPDNAYRRISPKECRFSDREDYLSTDARHLTFVQNGCPSEGISSIIPPLANVNGEVYFSKFKTFRFGEKSTVFVHCTVQVCLDVNDKECSLDCFKRIHSNLTADRLRFRHKRSPSNISLDTPGEVQISSQLTILDDDETQEIRLTQSQSTKQCLSPATASFTVMVIIGMLSSGFFLSTLCAIGMFCKMRKGKSETFEVYGAYATAMAPAFRY